MANLFITDPSTTMRDIGNMCYFSHDAISDFLEILKAYNPHICRFTENGEINNGNFTPILVPTPEELHSNNMGLGSIMNPMIDPFMSLSQNELGFLHYTANSFSDPNLLPMAKYVAEFAGEKITEAKETLAFSAGFETVHAVASHCKHIGKELAKDLTKLSSNMAEYRAVAKRSLHQGITKEYTEIVKKMNQGLRGVPKPEGGVNLASKAGKKLYVTKNLVINAEADALRMARFAKTASKACRRVAGVGLILGAIDVAVTAYEGGNWRKELASVIGEQLGAMAVGAIAVGVAVLVFGTPAGWVLVAAEAIGAVFGSQLMKGWAEKIYDMFDSKSLLINGQMQLMPGLLPAISTPFPF